MSILYFALGMLSMLGLIFVGVIIWGMFKVSKLERKIRNIEEMDRDRFDNVYRSFGEIRNDYRYQFEDVLRRFEIIEGNSRRNTDEVVRMLMEKFDESIRYTDKRIDKSLNNTYTVQTTTLKQIL